VQPSPAGHGNIRPARLYFLHGHRLMPQPLSQFMRPYPVPKDRRNVADRRNVMEFAQLVSFHIGIIHRRRCRRKREIHSRILIQA